MAESYERLQRFAREGDEKAVQRLILLSRRRGDWETCLGLLEAVAALDERLWTNPIDGSAMIVIPAGRCRLGSEGQVVEMPSFSMARHPVSNQQFAAFLEATGYEPDPLHPNRERFLAHWSEGVLPDELSPHPVVYVSLIDALHYCEWAQLGLPSEWMWERAARGDDGRPFPWGSEPPSGKLANLRGNGSTVPIGSYQDVRTAYGCQDMVGNVSDWCLPLSRDLPGEIPAVPELSFAENQKLVQRVPVRGTAFHRGTPERMSCMHRRVLSSVRRNHWVGLRPVTIVRDDPSLGRQ